MKKLKFDILATFLFAALVLLLFKLGVPCIFRAVTGIPCPGCGMTRAVISLLRADIADVFYYHPLVFLLLPVYVLFLLRRKASDRVVKTVALSVAALFIAVYLVRLLLLPDSLIYIL